MKRTIKNNKILKRFHQQIVRDNAADLMMNHIKFKIEDEIRYLETHANNLNIPRDVIFEFGKIYSQIYWHKYPKDISAKELREYYITVMKIKDKYERKGAII